MNDLLQTVAFGFYLLDRHQYPEAAGVAAQILSEDPQQASAHRLYLAAQIDERALPRAAVEARYRAWLAQEATSELRKTVLAFGLGYAQAGPGDWCAEVDRLTSPLPKDVELQYWALRVRRDAHLDGCPGGSPEDDLAAIAALNLEFAQPFVAVVRLASQPVTPALAAELKLAWEREPWRLGNAFPLWQEGVSGEALEQARQEAILAPRQHVDSIYLENVYGALVVAQSAGEEDLEKELFYRMQKLDPEWGKSAPVFASLEAARQAPGDAVALSMLLSIKKQFHGKELAQWWLVAADRLEDMGKTEQSWDAVNRAHQHDPELTSVRWVSAMADAADAGRASPAQLRGAIREVERWLDVPLGGARHPALVGVWTRDALSLRADHYLLLARLKAAQNDAEGTEQAYRMALLLKPRWDGYLALGTLLAHQGRDDEALEALLTGLSMAPASPSPEQRTRLEAAMHLALPLWEQGRWWDPEGIQGFVEASRALISIPSPVEPEKKSLVQVFPDLDLQWAGISTRLKATSGPMVVDLWASWCGPCIQSLPHLAELAAATPQVPFMAVSVDKKIEDAERFISRATNPAYRPYWSGPAAMGKLGINSIPATYLLDDQYQVVARFTGWMPGDRRLEQAIAELLGNP